MLTYVFKRALFTVPVLLVTSFLVFLIVELPPGDFFSNRCAEMAKLHNPPPPGCPSR